MSAKDETKLTMNLRPPVRAFDGGPLMLPVAKPFWVYLLASERNGTLYVGSTDDLAKRIWEHKAALRKGFTSKYKVMRLVWCEPHESRESAFRRERRIKEWRRAWKLRLIEESNPRWLDLYERLFGGLPSTNVIPQPNPLAPAEAGVQSGGLGACGSGPRLSSGCTEEDASQMRIAVTMPSPS